MERKKKGWFERIKRLFISEPKPKPKQEKVCSSCPNPVNFWKISWC
jgi:hypothetical protein